MKQYKIKDNSFVKKENFSNIMGVVKAVADKTLEQLDREGIFVFPEMIDDVEDMTKKQMLLQSVNDSFLSGNVMGFIGVGDERLVIESRFSTGNNDFLFQYLLEKVLDFPNIVNMETDANQDDRLFSLLLFLFPYYLKTAMRKGVFKTYIRNLYNNANVKGIIDISRHIKKNIPFTGNVAYSQREYSYDNYLLELIRHTIEHIKKKPYGNRLLSQVKDEVKLVVEVTSDYELYDKRKIINENKKNVVRHAFFREYRALQQLCILILQNQKHQIGSGSRRIYGILFDGAWLWEEYMNMLVGDIFYHPMNKAKQGGQYLFAGNKGKIYPDFISKNEIDRVIADAKYKPIDNIGNKDYLQLLAYMFRFDAKKGFCLYPEAENTDDLRLCVNKGSSYENNVSAREEVCVTKHGLKIPNDTERYDDFVSKIKECEVVFIKRLLECQI